MEFSAADVLRPAQLCRKIEIGLRGVDCQVHHLTSKVHEIRVTCHIQLACFMEPMEEFT